MPDTARAWKDPLFRATLTDAELAALPASPVGTVESLDAVDVAFGGDRPASFHTCLTCHATCYTCFTCHNLPWCK